MFKNIADELIKILQKEGITAYIWYIATTGSIYIRCTSGVGSIRIGDHNGREKLKYKWNIRSDVDYKTPKWIMDEYWRCYINVDYWKKLIPLIKERYIRYGDNKSDTKNV